MTPPPGLALCIIAQHPELRLHHEIRRDLIGLEHWGAILSQPEANGHSSYRYLLWRIFDASKQPLAVIMLNPSKATHLEGDRTIDGLIRRARRHGYGAIYVINCFAYRATNPVEMEKALDPVGPANDSILDLVFKQDLDLLCAWGVRAARIGREKEVKCAIASGRAKPHVLRLCSGGAPEHPLYVPTAIGLSPWSLMPDDSSSGEIPCLKR